MIKRIEIHTPMPTLSFPPVTVEEPPVPLLAGISLTRLQAIGCAKAGTWSRAALGLLPGRLL